MHTVLMCKDSHPSLPSIMCIVFRVVLVLTILHGFLALKIRPFRHRAQNLIEGASQIVNSILMICVIISQQSPGNSALPGILIFATLLSLLIKLGGQERYLPFYIFFLRIGTLSCFNVIALEWTTICRFGHWSFVSLACGTF